MRISLVFSGFGTVADTIPVVVAAEQCGLDGIWSSEYLGFHDAVVPSSIYLGHTQHIDIGLMGLSAAGRHPGLCAMELMSLAEMAPGRIRCQAGLGDAAAVARLGGTTEKPVQSTEALVRCLRDTMQGNVMQESHDSFTFNGYRLAAQAQPPLIDIMAIRPRMVQLACQLGDGISLSMGASHQYLREVIADVERELESQGRSHDTFRITAVVMACINDNLESACAPVAAINAGAHQSTAAYLARGIADADALADIERSEGKPGVQGYWIPERVQQIALVSDRDGLAEKLKSYADLGIDELAVMLVNPMQEQSELAQQLAEARP